MALRAIGWVLLIFPTEFSNWLLTNAEKYDTIKEKGVIRLAKVKKANGFNLELFDGYFVTADEYQYILNKRGVNGKGEEKVETVGYYVKLQYLIEDLANKQLRKANVTSLEEFRRELDKIAKKIDRLVPEFEVSHTI